MPADLMGTFLYYGIQKYRMYREIIHMHWKRLKHPLPVTNLLMQYHKIGKQAEWAELLSEIVYPSEH